MSLEAIDNGLTAIVTHTKEVGAIEKSSPTPTETKTKMDRAKHLATELTKVLMELEDDGLRNTKKDERMRLAWQEAIGHISVFAGSVSLHARDAISDINHLDSNREDVASYARGWLETIVATRVDTLGVIVALEDAAALNDALPNQSDLLHHTIGQIEDHVDSYGMEMHAEQDES